jgi:predicted cobalt transporter CbtA
MARPASSTATGLDLLLEAVAIGLAALTALALIADPTPHTCPVPAVERQPIPNVLIQRQAAEDPVLQDMLLHD